MIFPFNFEVVSLAIILLIFCFLFFFASINLQNQKLLKKVVHPKKIRKFPNAVTSYVA